MSEQIDIERELVKNHRQVVCVVRPSFGSQSDSWNGQLYAETSEYPPKFQVQTNIGSTRFEASDVASVEVRYTGEHEPRFIIRLKGQADYVGQHA